jgi:hypothetical protein
MNGRTIALLALLAAAGCGGGGGGSAAPVPAGNSTAPDDRASFPLTISIPRATASAARAPLFVSPAVAAFAFYDGTTLLYVANVSTGAASGAQFTTVYAKPGTATVTPGTCTATTSAATCTLTVTSTIGAHTFDLIAYPANQSGTPPTFTGVISSEGEITANLSPGTNPAQTLTMLPVASQVTVTGASSGAFNATTTLGLQLLDSTLVEIVLPGAYDNGPITLTAAPAGIVTIAPSSFSTPVATKLSQSFGVTCVNANGGSVTITVGARTSPNTAYASGLTYSAGNYSGATIGTTPFTCNPGTGSLPITVQTRKRT